MADLGSPEESPIGAKSPVIKISSHEVAPVPARIALADSIASYLGRGDPHAGIVATAGREPIIPKFQQFHHERTYDTAIQIRPAEYSIGLSPQEITRRMELDHVVKQAPSLDEQLTDGMRTNTINYQASHVVETADAALPIKSKPYLMKTITESEGLSKLAGGLEVLADTDPQGTYWYSRAARSLRENLTFIGKKEYDEAVAGIADYWKTLLNDNQKLRISAITGEIARGYFGKSKERNIKSDQYLLDNILAQFSDEELKAFGGRLTTNLDALTDMENTRIVLLDDWTSSGTQFADVTEKIVRDQWTKYGRDISGNIEAQLIVASADRIKRGTIDLPSESTPDRPSSMIPIKAYYMSHDSDITVAYRSGTHITGSFSATDFDFQLVIEKMIYEYNRLRGSNHEMPPLTNILQPYKFHPLKNIGRLNKIERRRSGRQMSSKETADIHALPDYPMHPDNIEWGIGDSSGLPIDELRAQEIQNHTLLAALPPDQRTEVASNTIELYKAAKEYVAPAVTAFADYLLREAGNRQIICAGRDGLGTYIAAEKLKEKFDYANHDPQQLVYAMLTRKLLQDTKSRIVRKYLKQEGVHNVREGVILADIGAYGTTLPELRAALPHVDIRYFISRNPQIPGFADGPERTMRAFATHIENNPAAHFIEDTFSGVIPSSTRLDEDESDRLVPNRFHSNYSAAEALTREYAIKAIYDYADAIEKKLDQDEIRAAITKLDNFLVNPSNYEHLMAPHEL